MLFFSLIAVATVVAQTTVSNASSVASSSSSPLSVTSEATASVVCDAVALALVATAAVKNDTCFLKSTTCEQCTIDRQCAFCRLVHVSVSGRVLDTDFATTCDMQSVCWAGDLFNFVGDVDSIMYAGNRLALEVTCDDPLPQFGQCALTGLLLMVAAGGAALVVLCLCAILVAVVCCCCCSSRSRSRQSRYERLQDSGDAAVNNRKVHAPYAGDRKGYGSASQI